MFSSWTMKDINAYVTTAANGFESSWGTYCPPQDKVGGVPLDTCLGDLYSVNWMEDSDLTDLSGESLKEQFRRVKNETKKSHVGDFGLTSIKKEIVGNFQSTYDKKAADGSDDDDVVLSEVQISPDSVSDSSAVDAHDIDLVIAFYRYLRASPGKERRSLSAQLIQKVIDREAADELFEQIHALYEQEAGQPLLQAQEPQDTECYDSAARVFESECGPVAKSGDAEVGHGFTSYTTKYAGTLVDLCEGSLSTSVVETLIRQACGRQDGIFNPNVAMLS